MKKKLIKIFYCSAIFMLMTAFASLNCYAAADDSGSGGFPVMVILIPVIIAAVIAVLVVISKTLNSSHVNNTYQGMQQPNGYGNNQIGMNGTPYGGSQQPMGYGNNMQGGSIPPYGSNVHGGASAGNFSYPSQININGSGNGNIQANAGSTHVALKCPNCGAPLDDNTDTTVCPYCRSVLTNPNLLQNRRNRGPIDFSAQDSVFNGFGDDAVHTGYGEEDYRNTYGSGYGIGFDNDSDFD